MNGNPKKYTTAKNFVANTEYHVEIRQLLGAGVHQRTITIDSTEENVATNNLPKEHRDVDVYVGLGTVVTTSSIKELKFHNHLAKGEHFALFLLTRMTGRFYRFYLEMVL